MITVKWYQMAAALNIDLEIPRLMSGLRSSCFRRRFVAKKMTREIMSACSAPPSPAKTFRLVSRSSLKYL